MTSPEELIYALRQGDERAYATLVKSYGKMVYSTAFGFFNNHADAEDLTQEVFVEAFHSINQFRGEASISTWLYRITVNKSINQLKKNKNREHLSASLTHDEKKPLWGHTKSPDTISENLERRHILHLAIDTLPALQKAAFILHKHKGLSYKEVAKVMKTSLSSVESLIHRAKKNLQKKLIHYYSS